MLELFLPVILGLVLVVLLIERLQQRIRKSKAFDIALALGIILECYLIYPPAALAALVFEGVLAAFSLLKSRVGQSKAPASPADTVPVQPVKAYAAPSSVADLASTWEKRPASAASIQAPEAKPAQERSAPASPPVQPAQQKQKRPVVLLIAALLATLIFAYIYTYLGNTTRQIAAMAGAEAIGAGLGVLMSQPFVIVYALATIFAWLSYLFLLRWAAITAGVLFAVAIALLFVWGVFPVVPMILCFVGAAKLKSV